MIGEQFEEEEKPVEDTIDSSVWEYGKNPSKLKGSEGDMSDVRKSMIRFALDYPIHDIRTYSGYKGDLLVEITMTDYDLLPVFKAHAESLGMQTVVKERHDIRVHEIYCITPNEDIYGLKLDE
jgi:hypothetical protein